MLEITKKVSTAADFDEKYSQFLVPGFYGCDLHIPAQIEYLDDIFSKELIWEEGFMYKQIKSKFRSYRFYADGISQDKINLIEVILKSLENG